MRINADLAKSAVVAALGLTVAAALWGTTIGAMFGGVTMYPESRR